MPYNPFTAKIPDLISELQELTDPKYKDGMKRFAVGNEQALGVKLPHLRELAKPLKKRSDRHAFALALWKKPIHEAKLLAGIIADPKLFSPQDMDQWVHDFYSWDVCDQACGNLFRNTPFYVEKAMEYSHAETEFVKRCGFTLMAQYAQHAKKKPDSSCLVFLQRIEEEAWDGRNFVKKAVNWALREIGKRNRDLLVEAETCCERLLEQPHSSAHWIARDALREFKRFA